jgi:hypothetical protein
MTYEQTLEEQLEGLMDRFGIVRFMDTIADIAGLKAEHVMRNWEDEELAGEWEAVGSELDNLYPIFKKVEEPSPCEYNREDKCQSLKLATLRQQQ